MSKKKVLWTKLILRRVILLAGVLIASWALEKITNRSHVVGKGGELILTALVDRFFFGVPVEDA